MNREIRDQWTAALRSGEYAQTTGYLRTTEGYCCLGVLCDLAVKAGAISEPKAVSDGSCRCWSYDPADDGSAWGSFNLPGEVMEWAGIDEVHGAEVYLTPLTEEILQDSLAERNDGGATFAEIADLIEEYL